jgi:hypothetical protein
LVSDRDTTLLGRLSERAARIIERFKIYRPYRNQPHLSLTNYIELFPRSDEFAGSCRPRWAPSRVNGVQTPPKLIIRQSTEQRGEARSFTLLALQETR